MKKLMDSILLGIKTIENTKERYLDIAETAQDKLDAMKVANLLSNDDDAMTRLINKSAAANSHVQYLEFIQKQLSEIKNFVEAKGNSDLNHGCLYFGTNTLYFNEELLKYNEKEIFEIILNHIIHYTGCFYIISSSDVRLSYLLSAISVCYGESVNYKDGKMIYQNNKDKFKHIMFDISNNYKTFIIRNRKVMKFFKHISKVINPEESLIYRIVLGNRIKLENMLISIDDLNNISNVRSYSYNNNDEEVFHLA